MTGILLLFVLLVWGAVSVAMAHVFTWRIPSAPLRLAAAALAFCVLLVLPVLDEVIGAFQFSALCMRHSEFKIGVSDPTGRVTRYASNPLNAQLEGTAVPIRHTHITYTDVISGEVVVQFDRYNAKGGWLIHALGISQSDSPLLIGKPSCSPEAGTSVHRTLKFTVVN